MIVGQRVTPEMKQTASFLGSKGIDVTCVEFTFFKAAEGGRLLSQEIVVGGERRSRPVVRAGPSRFGCRGCPGAPAPRPRQSDSRDAKVRLAQSPVVN